MTNKVDITAEAGELLARLRARNGELMFHQSGGCCDGSSPMCFVQGDFITSEADIHLGDLQIGLPEPEQDKTHFSVPFWMSVNQYEYWKHTHLTVDVVPGRGAGFSLEAPEGVRFIIRSRIFTDAELAELGLDSPPAVGAQTAG